MTHYPTLANETIVERKGENALDRQAHQVLTHEKDDGTSPATADGDGATGDPGAEPAEGPIGRTRATDHPGLHVTFEDEEWNTTLDPSKVVFFSFNCQRNQGRRHYGLPIAGRVSAKRDPQNQNSGTAQWDWDGDMKQPSLNPSIHCVGCCHGYITKGAWDDRGAG